MESNLSGLSSLKDDPLPLFVQPHYKESYRLAIYALLCGGREAYEAYLRAEQIHSFLSESEIAFILQNARVPAPDDSDQPGAEEVSPSTYFPTDSDEEVPELELGWPEVKPEEADTSISLLFHPPRHNTPTIKEVVRRQIQEARQVIAIAMDVFTDINIFKEILSAALRGVAVYILLDDSQVDGFFQMSRSIGVNIHDIKNLRVRTVEGQQYQCQSGKKFHGGLEQKFILVDSRTVLYGTYSFTWSFEKIHLSMVLVITGQLVSSFDEEFRRLYGRSTAPFFLSREPATVQPLRKSVGVQNPNSSQLSLNLIHLMSKGTQNHWGAQPDEFSDAGRMNRGLSVQEKLHQSHYPPLVNSLRRGHSYGEELQRVNSMTRLRMGTKDLGAPAGPDRLPASRLSQQQRRHQTRYGAHQNLIPFNSETSLHRWKIDSYLSGRDELQDGACDSVTPLTSPHSSQMGLNELQSQMIQKKSREIKLRMEEIRQKRLSLQESFNLRQSQESLRSTYSNFERQMHPSATRNFEVRQSVADFLPRTQTDGMTMDGEQGDQFTTDVYRPSSQYDLKTVADPRGLQALGWTDPVLSCSKSDSGGLSLQHPRVMESLIEIPEEREVPNNHGDGRDWTKGVETVASNTNTSAKPQRDQSKSSRHSSISTSSTTPRDGAQLSRTLNHSVKMCQTGEVQMSHKDKEQTLETSDTHRKNSFKSKRAAVVTDDVKRAPMSEEVSLHRRMENSPDRTDDGQSPFVPQVPKRGPSLKSTRTPSTPGASAKMEKPKSAFAKLSPQRSSKRKTNLLLESDRESRSTLEDEAAASSASTSQSKRAYSRFEYLLTREDTLPDRPSRHRLAPSDRNKSLSMGRQETGFPGYHAQNGANNKFGRFMQRVGSLIHKHK